MKGRALFVKIDTPEVNECLQQYRITFPVQLNDRAAAVLASQILPPRWRVCPL
jgi:hypothetical protein